MHNVSAQAFDLMAGAAADGPVCAIFLSLFSYLFCFFAVRADHSAEEVLSCHLRAQPHFPALRPDAEGQHAQGETRKPARCSAAQLSSRRFSLLYHSSFVCHSFFLFVCCSLSSSTSRWSCASAATIRGSSRERRCVGRGRRRGGCCSWIGVGTPLACSSTLDPLTNHHLLLCLTFDLLSPWPSLSPPHPPPLRTRRSHRT